jgi:hypothetical protein
MAGMGSIEAQKGRWGAFTDVIYMNVGGTKATTRNLTVEGAPLPVDADITANAGIKSWIWTLAGSYRIQAEPDSTFDVFGGARMLWLQPTLNFGVTTSTGPLAGPQRTGSLEVTGRNWDAIVGAKGRASFGANREWFIPYYSTSGRASRSSRGRARRGSDMRSRGASSLPRGATSTTTRSRAIRSTT